jgi:GNAT superfamily N-acetyltransferase
MITFEKAAVVDAGALTEVQTRAFDDDSRRFADQPSGGPPGYDSFEWQIKMMNRAMYYKILADAQVIGGLIIFNMGRGYYVLGRIYIAPDFQDQGIGTRAMQFIEETFPARKWTLETPSWATRNHHFYEKVGYVKVREVEEHGEVGFLYEKRLTGGAE